MQYSIFDSVLNVGCALFLTACKAFFALQSAFKIGHSFKIGGTPLKSFYLVRKYTAKFLSELRLLCWKVQKKIMEPKIQQISSAEGAGHSKQETWNAQAGGTDTGWLLVHLEGSVTVLQRVNLTHANGCTSGTFGRCFPQKENKSFL